MLGHNNKQCSQVLSADDVFAADQASKVPHGKTACLLPVLLIELTLELIVLTHSHLHI